MPIINQVVAQGGGSAPAHYIEKAVDANGKLVNGSSIIDLTGVTDIGDYVLYYAYYHNTAISGAVDMSDLTTISGANACQFMFYGCSGLTSANMSSLTTLTGNQACSSMFRDCTSLATVRIGNTTAIDFGTRTNQFQGMFTGCTQNIDVYAPAASQSAIEGLTGYPNFGATGTVTWHWNS